MKKYTILSMFFCLLLVHVKAQNGIIFKIKYLPNHLYELNIVTNMTMEMNISGDSLTMAAMKAKGIVLPMELTTTSTMNSNIRTGAIKSEDTFPLIMNYTNITSKKTLNGKEMASSPSPLTGQTLYGESTTSGKMHIDSMSGKTLDENLKATLTTAISNMLSQMHFPDKPLNIGDSFIQEVPFNLPISGINMQFTINLNYKLIAVQNNSAFFDLKQSMTMDMSSPKDSITMTGTGTGDGKMVYSIDQNFATSTTSNFGFNYKMQIKEMTMEGKAKMSSTKDTKINVIDKQ